MGDAYDGLFDEVEAFFHKRNEACGQEPCSDESLQPMHKAYIACCDAADERELLKQMELDDEQADWGLGE